ncbi:hypothetical protein Hbl1158_10210 [Halobaculum sp. CBA1158]|uniref:hypothetical protein n=1 Tax=Halobaculum sp. CBA1158 TaxID=2904243 RepID=UPI001F275BC8|nr:hypothetical protein [Halobaculum sp. CBA1158]UIO98907.1 hypothetical protein Hbl1158_10210 [Halobaculum sp. CBA1158]
MNRRSFLVLSVVGLAGCGGTSSEPTEPSTTVQQSEPSTATESPTPTDTATQTSTPTETPEPETTQPAIRNSDITVDGDYRGDATPRGATLNVTATFDLWAHDGTAEGEVRVLFEPPVGPTTEVTSSVTETGEEFVVQEYDTTVDTAGWPAGTHTGNISVTDTISGEQSLVTEHTIQLAEYTRTVYNQVADDTEAAQAAIDDAMQTFTREGGQSILDITPETGFNKTAVTEPALKARRIVDDALDQEVTPFESELQRIDHLGGVIVPIAEAQNRIVQTQNSLFDIANAIEDREETTIENRLETLRERLNEDRQSINSAENPYRDGRDYPLPFADKIDALRTDRSKISGFTTFIEDLRYGVGLLNDGRVAERTNNYDRAESLAIDANREFERVARELRSMSSLPDTVDKYTRTSESLQEEAEELRQEVSSP